MKEELESNFQDIFLNTSVHRADLLEQMPEDLKNYARGSSVLGLIDIK